MKAVKTKKKLWTKNIRSDFTNIMKRERRVEGRGRDNASGTDNKQRKLQAGGYNGLLSGKNKR